VEPETLIFIGDNAESTSTALLMVGYKTSASIGVYSFDCNAKREYMAKPMMEPPANVNVDAMQTADTCSAQQPCLDLHLRPIVSSDDLRRRRRRMQQHVEDEEFYRICLSFNEKNPYCVKSDDYFTYAASLEEEQNGDFMVLEHWLYGETRCQTVPCSDFAQFVVKDGDGCAASEPLDDVSIDGLDGISCSASLHDSCVWKVPSPQCSHFSQIAKPGTITLSTTTTTTTTSTTNYVVSNDDGANDQNGGQSNDKNRDGSTFDAMTNRGGHFAESAMFYILLTFCALTICCIVGCVIKHSQKRVAQPNDDDGNVDDIEEGVVVDQPLQFENQLSL